MIIGAPQSEKMISNELPGDQENLFLVSLLFLMGLCRRDSGCLGGDSALNEGWTPCLFSSAINVPHQGAGVREICSAMETEISHWVLKGRLFLFPFLTSSFLFNLFLVGFDTGWIQLKVCALENC